MLLTLCANADPHLILPEACDVRGRKHHEGEQATYAEHLKECWLQPSFSRPHHIYRSLPLAGSWKHGNVMVGDMPTNLRGC